MGVIFGSESELLMGVIIGSESELLMGFDWGRRQNVQDSYFVSFLDIAACCQKMPDGMAPGQDGRISLILTQVQIP